MRKIGKIRDAETSSYIAKKLCIEREREREIEILHALNAPR